MPDEIKCARCGEKRAALGYAPYPNELGQKIGAEVCQQCWREWLQKQQMIINHYGLNLMDPQARQFLTRNMEAFLFKSGNEEEMDVSKKGTTSS